MVRGSMVCFALVLSASVAWAADEIPQVPVDKLRAEMESLRASLEAEQQKSGTLQKLNDAQRTLNLELQKQLDDLRKSLESTAKDRDARMTQVQAGLDELKAATAKSAADRDATAKLQNEQIPALKKEIESVRQQLVGEQLKSKALAERNDQLQRQVDDVTRQMARESKTVPVKTVALEKPKPAPTVRGKVTELDSARQLLVVNLGMEAGLKQGDVLEVFRVTANPKESLYLGQATVIRSTETSSVCRYTGVAEGRFPQLNDAVATSLTNPK